MNMNTDRQQWLRTKMRTIGVSRIQSHLIALRTNILNGREYSGENLFIRFYYIIILLLFFSSFFLLASFGKCENFNKFYFCRRSQITGWHFKYLDSNVAQLFLSPREQRTKTTKATNNNKKEV